MIRALGRPIEIFHHLEQTAKDEEGALLQVARRDDEKRTARAREFEHLGVGAIGGEIHPSAHRALAAALLRVGHRAANQTVDLLNQPVRDGGASGEREQTKSDVDAAHARNGNLTVRRARVDEGFGARGVLAADAVVHADDERDRSVHEYLLH